VYGEAYQTRSPGTLVKGCLSCEFLTALGTESCSSASLVAYLSMHSSKTLGTYLSFVLKTFGACACWSTL